MPEPRLGGPSEIVGKTITGVVIKDGEDPRRQVFLLFSDGTSYEFYGSSIVPTSGADAWDLQKVARYMGRPISYLALAPPPADGDRRNGARDRRRPRIPKELPSNVLRFRRPVPDFGRFPLDELPPKARTARRS